MRIPSSFNLLLASVLFLLITFILTTDSFAQPGDLVWGTAPATTSTINGANGASPPTDSFTEDGVDIDINYSVNPSPATNPVPITPVGAAMCPGPGTIYMQNCNGSTGGVTDIEFMGMNMIGAGSGNCEGLETITIDFDPPIENPTFTIADVDAGISLCLLA